MECGHLYQLRVILEAQKGSLFQVAWPRLFMTGIKATGLGTSATLLQTSPVQHQTLCDQVSWLRDYIFILKVNVSLA